MDTLHDVLRELETYCQKVGVSPGTVCARATNNARLYERLKRRAEKTEADVAALQRYMQENPATGDAA